MGLLSRLLRRGPSAATIDNPRFNLNDPEAVDALLGGNTATSTGQSVNAEKVLTWAAWWRGVNFLAKVVAKCPCHVYETDPDGDYGSTAALDHPAYKLLRWKANEWQTAFQFRLALAGHAINRGNGYAYIYRAGPNPVEMVLLDPDATEPAMIGGALWYTTKIAGDERKLPAADVFHLRGFGFDGLRGYPLWQMAREAISLGLSADQFRGSRYKNSARPSIVLETANKMQDQAVTRLRNDWERMHTGLDNAHRTAILDNGLKANTLSFSPEEMQEVESAGLRLRDAANFLGIPSSKLGDVAGVKYASKEQDDRNAMEDGADYWLCAFETEAWDKLLLESEKAANTRIVSFDRKCLIAFDLMTQANYYRTATGGRGWMSPAEVREELHMEPRDEPDIDTVLTPLNLGQGGADNKPADMNDPEPGRPTDQQDGGAGNSNGGETQSGTGLAQAPGRTSDAAVRGAARVALAQAARRMCRRVALHASRAAKDGAKYLAWVDGFGPEHKGVVQEAFEPARQMMQAGDTFVTGPTLTAAFLNLLCADYTRLADEFSPAKLPAAVDALNAELEKTLPAKLCDLYLGADK